MGDEKHEAERKEIRRAAEELLARTDGKRPVIEDLRQRVGVQRWILTHRHRDLKDEFLRAVDAKWGVSSPAVTSLQEKYDALQGTYQRLRERNAELEQLLDTYAYVIEELRLQLDHSIGSDKVRPIRPR
ncbi:hypothetical protein [Geodermatophilus sp. CPCC 205761]|uniref:hypothetical protein n=1 Tax=Geodermatophilus sp. CPCC 205761 TaxID=2936597 RepID=UPI003EEEEE98